MTSNKRQFSRCNFFRDTTAAELVVEGRRRPCELAQVSIGGSAVVVREKIAISKSGFAFFKVDGVESVVRITHQEPHPQGFLVGMEILEEVPPQAQSGLMTLAWFGLFGSVAAAAWYAIVQLQASV